MGGANSTAVRQGRLFVPSVLFGTYSCEGFLMELDIPRGKWDLGHRYKFYLSNERTDSLGLRATRHYWPQPDSQDEDLHCPSHSFGRARVTGRGRHHHRCQFLPPEDRRLRLFPGLRPSQGIPDGADRHAEASLGLPVQHHHRRRLQHHSQPHWIRW